MKWYGFSVRKITSKRLSGQEGKSEEEEGEEEKRTTD